MKKEKVICHVCREKNYIPVMKKQLPDIETLYPTFCPDPERIVENEMDGIIQKCKHCGYIFTRIDENIGISKKKIESDLYIFPFGKEYDGPVEAVECYKIALAAVEADANLMAAKWFINSAVLLPEAYQRKSFKNAFLSLRKGMGKYYTGKNAEVTIAYLNVMRLLGMYDCVERQGEQIKKYYTGIESKLIETICRMAKEKDKQYLCYLDMLIENTE